MSETERSTAGVLLKTELLSELEPHGWKHACSVLKRERRREASDLSGAKKIICVFSVQTALI